MHTYHLSSRMDYYLGRVPNLTLFCDTTVRMFTSVFCKYTELISVIFKFMGVVNIMALEACRQLLTYNYVESEDRLVRETSMSRRECFSNGWLFLICTFLSWNQYQESRIATWC